MKREQLTADTLIAKIIYHNKQNRAGTDGLIIDVLQKELSKRFGITLKFNK